MPAVTTAADLTALVATVAGVAAGLPAAVQGLPVAILAAGWVDSALSVAYQ